VPITSTLLIGLEATALIAVNGILEVQPLEHRLPRRDMALANCYSAAIAGIEEAYVRVAQRRPPDLASPGYHP
jgi:hypothetical protein